MASALDDIEKLLQRPSVATDAALEEQLLVATGLTRCLYLLALCAAEDDGAMSLDDPRDAMALLQLATAASAAASAALVIQSRQADSANRPAGAATGNFSRRSTGA